MKEQIDRFIEAKKRTDELAMERAEASRSLNNLKAKLRDFSNETKKKLDAVDSVTLANMRAIDLNTDRQIDESKRSVERQIEALWAEHRRKEERWKSKALEDERLDATLGVIVAEQARVVTQCDQAIKTKEALVSKIAELEAQPTLFITMSI